MHRSGNGHYTGCASRRIGRAGRTYSFCGAGCQRTFESPEAELKSMRTIKRNLSLTFTFIYNAVGVTNAAFGLLNPIIAAAAMALSSPSVIVNSALLKGARLQYSWSLP